MKDGIQITDRGEFNEIVGIMRYQHFGELSIQPASLLGSFFGADFEELVVFCKENSRYHVITFADGTIFNRPIPGYNVYYLGNGSADPRLFNPAPPYAFKMCLEFLAEVAGRGTQNQTLTLGERLDNIVRKYEGGHALGETRTSFPSPDEVVDLRRGRRRR